MFFNWSLFVQIGYTSFLDTLTRCYLNDFFFNTYYYFWTSFWYIPLFVASIGYAVILLQNSLSLKIIQTTTLLICVFIFEICDYWTINLTFYNLHVNADNINFLLTNSINKYHPFIFYSSLTFLFSLLCVVSNFSSKKLNQHFTYTLYKVMWTRSHELTVLFIVFTLFLGSWWAVQEGSWGGWWNWDPSEMFGLLVMICLIILMHKKMNYSSFIAFFYFILIYWVAIAGSYVFIQLNFNLVSHNFGIKVSQFINTTQFFIILGVLIIWASILILHNYITLVSYYYLLNNSNMKVPLTHKILTWVVFTAIFISEFIVSFYPLINDFLWKVFQTNILLVLLNYTVIIIVGLVYASTFFYKPVKYFLLLYLFLLKVNVWVLLYLMPLHFQAYLVLAGHYSILLFVICNIYIFMKIWVNWSLIVNLTYVNIQNIFYDWGPLNYTLNSNNVEVELMLLSNNNNCSKIYNFFSSNSVTNLELFNQVFSTFTSFQHLVGGLFQQFFFITIGDNSLLPVYTGFIFIFIYIWTFFSKKQLIIL